VLLDCGGVLMKNILDFSKLKVLSNASLKSLRMAWILMDSRVVGVFISIISSTHWLWEVAR